MGPTFSIIIPVYNIANYLQNCIDSIYCQTCKDYEIVLVDDGSTDNSGVFCDKLKEANPNVVRVFHKANGGLSSARNFGIRQALGEYLIFIDGDDEFNKSRLNVLDQIKERVHRFNEDIILYGSQKKNHLTNQYIPSICSDFQVEIFSDGKNKWDVLSYLGRTGKFPGSACTFAIKKLLVDRTSIQFVDGMTAEDIYWVINCFYYASSIGVVNELVYTYNYQREGSITSQPRYSSIVGIMYAIDDWKQKNVGKEGIGIVNFLCRVLCVAIYNYAVMTNPTDRAKSEEQIKQRIWLFNQSNLCRYRMLYALINIFGLKFLSKVVLMLVKVKKA